MVLWYKKNLHLTSKLLSYLIIYTKGKKRKRKGLKMTKSMGCCGLKARFET